MYHQEVVTSQSVSFTPFPVLPSRYIMSEQKKAEEFGITEDDVSEIRQDINKFRFELVDILRKNNFDIGKVRNEGCYSGKRAKQMERRIMKVKM